MNKLQDTDLMPFGQHKGKPMQDVPATYLHYLWTQRGLKDDKYNPVADYIRRRKAVLEMEFIDGIWD